MSSQNGDSSKLLQDAVTTLEGCNDKIETLIGEIGTAVNSHSDNVFGLLDSLLAPESTPTSWLQNGLASWIQCFKTQSNLYQSICATVCNSATTSPPLRGVVYRPDSVTFNLDQFTEATDPTSIIGVSPNTPDALNPQASTVVDEKPIHPENLNLSVSSDGKAVQLALVGLKSKLPFNPTGTYYSTPGTYVVKLTWQGVPTLSIYAVVG
jgi:hypothetical protein